ncbi:hypothetical protein FRB99_000318 [Tulasnella sp. 403]|nr:hypothetical protein FRB99_000318 [Tulasnella sp. 403]
MILSAIPTLKPAEATPAQTQIPKERTGRLKVVADNPSYNGYVSCTLASNGAGQFNAQQNQAMQIKYTPGPGPFRINLLNCATGYKWLGASLLDKTSKLGPGGTAYAYLTAMNDSNYGSIACPANWGGPVRAIMWSIGPDDTISATWDVGGTTYDIGTVAAHTSTRATMFLATDYTAFANAYGSSSYTKARLVFEPIN